MSDALQLHLVLEPFGPAGAFFLTDEQVESLQGGRKNPPVVVRVNDGSAALRVARMGGRNAIGVRKELRAELGLVIGGAYDVEVSLDDEPREVEVPDDLAARLADEPEARAFFEGLSYTKRKEFAAWLTDAKRAETRSARLEKTMELLRAGKSKG